MTRAAVHHWAADPELSSFDRESSLAAAADFRDMVARLHAAGIEVYLQVQPGGWAQAGAGAGA